MARERKSKYILEAEDRTKLALKKAEANFKQFGRTIKSSLTGISGITAALGGGLFSGSVIKNTIRQENALKQLESRLKSTGGAVGFAKDEITAYASELQNLTTFGDEEILEMQSQLLTFTKITGDEFQAASKAILDMSIVMGTDLKSSVLQVGKALNDPAKGISALTRSGIQFTEEQENMIKSLAETGRVADAQKLILAELSVQFGGAAEAARDTLGGALQSLSNAFGDLLEADGAGVNDAKEAIEELTKLMSSSTTKEGFQSVIGGIFAIINSLAKGVVAFNVFANALGESIGEFKLGLELGDLERRLIVLGNEAHARSGQALADNLAEQESIKALIRIKEQVIVQAKNGDFSSAFNNAPTFDEPIIQSAPLPATESEFTDTGKKLGKKLVEGVKSSISTDMDDVVATFADDMKAIESITFDIFPEEEMFNQIEAIERLISLYPEFSQTGQIAINAIVTEMGELGNKTEEVGDKTEETANKMDEFSVQAARNIQSQFADFLFDPFDKGLDGMLEGFARTIQRMLADVAAAKLSEALFGDFGKTGKIGGIVGNILSDVLHDGGIVGSGGSTRSVSPLVFANAERFHSGGIIGPRERPIIAEIDEEMLTRDDPRHILNGGGGTTINNYNTIQTPDPSAFKGSEASTGSQLARLMGNAKRNI